MREYEAKERGRNPTDTLGHKTQKGNVNWLLKYAKCETRNSNPFPNQQKPCYLSLSLLKPIINIAKTQKEAATKGALGIRT